jgi:hypothetical protein
MSVNRTCSEVSSLIIPSAFQATYAQGLRALIEGALPHRDRS